MLKHVQLPICKYETRKINVFSCFLDVVKRRQETDVLLAESEDSISYHTGLVTYQVPLAFCFVLLHDFISLWI